MSFSKAIKEGTRSALRNNWTKAIAIVFLSISISLLFNILRVIFGFILHIPNYFDILSTPNNFIDNIPNISISALIFSAVVILINLVVTVPLSYGTKNWFYALTKGTSQNILNIFYFFSSFKLLRKSIALFLNILIRIVLLSIIFCGLPMGIYFAISSQLSLTNSYTGIISTMLVILFSALSVLGAVFVGIRACGYFAAPYYISNIHTSSFKAIKLSLAATKNEKTNIFLFKISLIPYYIVNIFIFPLLYTKPYIQTSYAMYSHYLMEKQARILEKNHTSFLPLPLQKNINNEKSENE